jgi:RNA polymerase sigma factor (sigma-70 family)
MLKETPGTDDELLRMIKNDSSLNNAITHMYNAYFDSLSNYILQNSGSMEDAEDIFQEVIVSFVQIVNNNKFREESGIKTFLFAINKNLWLNELRRKNRTIVRENKFEANKEITDNGIFFQMADRESNKQIIGIIDKLGEACKKILLAFYYENLPMKDIVESMNYENEQVLRNKKYKCLKNLELLLSENPSLAKTLKSALQNE